MCYSDYADIVTKEEFRNVYQKIKESLIQGRMLNEDPNEDKCSIILGGQPGSGKSRFYKMREDLTNYIAINGDEYRIFHPNHDNIIKYDLENYAERTQSFCNKITEALISELGNKGYNLIIEGTLRNPEVPVKTCEYLKGRGYNPDLMVVACDAEKSWCSTITRAKILKEQGLVPRLVPIDIYNSTVNRIADNLTWIENKKCFDNITIFDRDGVVLYPNEKNEKASDILRRELNLSNWNNKYQEYSEQFIREKILLLQSSLDKERLNNEHIK